MFFFVCPCSRRGFLFVRSHHAPLPYPHCSAREQAAPVPPPISGLRRPPAACGAAVHIARHQTLPAVSGHPHQTARADGNGAAFFALPNFNLPAMKRTSACPWTCSCHQAVSVRAGSSPTTNAPRSASDRDLATHAPISRP